jgi:hypothetical protein
MNLEGNDVVHGLYGSRTSRRNDNQQSETPHALRIPGKDDFKRD